MGTVQHLRRNQGPRSRRVAAHHPNGQVIVWTDRGLFSLWFFRSAFVNNLAPAAEAEKLFDATTGVLTWNGVAHAMLGECAPVTTSRALTRHPGGDRVTLDSGGRRGAHPRRRRRSSADNRRRAFRHRAVGGGGVHSDGKRAVLADSVGGAGLPLRSFRRERTPALGRGRRDRRSESTLASRSGQPRRGHAPTDVRRLAGRTRRPGAGGVHPPAMPVGRATPPRSRPGHRP